MASSLSTVLGRINSELDRLDGKLTGIPSNMNIEEEIKELRQIFDKLCRKINYNNINETFPAEPAKEPTIYSSEDEDDIPDEAYEGGPFND